MISDLQFARFAATSLFLLVATACSDETSTPWPTATPELDAETEAFVDNLLERMSLEQKIGQIIQAEIQHVSPDDVREFGLGSVLNGGGVADVVLAGENGQIQHAPVGKLSFSWPAAPMPNPAGEFPTLFDFGFGLAYGEVPALGALPEDAMAPRAESTAEDADIVLFDGSASAPWRILLRDATAEILVDASGQIARTSGPAALTITPTDRKIQGDARRISWPGNTEDAVLLSTEESVDLRPLRDRSAAIAFDIRLESEPPHPISLAVECGESCAGSVALTGDLETLPTREWQSVHVALKCFESAGADLSRVSSVFAMSADGPVELSLADIRIEPQGASGATLGCDG